MLLSMYGNNTRKLQGAHASYLGQGTKIFEDLHKGVCLGTKEFAKTCMEELKDIKSSGVPKIKSPLKAQNINGIARIILSALGEDDPDAVFASKKKKRKINRDIAIYVLVNLGVFTNKEIGGVFGVGYSAVSEAAKRGRELLRSDKEIRKRIDNITIDI
jgi:chromosomal replication initiation ATPase DnaA